METDALKEALESAHLKLAEVTELLQPFMNLLSDKERDAIACAPRSFTAAGRAFARRADEFSTLCKAADYDRQKVVEALDKIELLSALDTAADTLQQRVRDARLAWTSDAYVPSLRLYAIGKVVARTDARTAQFIEPMVKCFRASRRRKKKSPKRVADPDNSTQPDALVEPEPAAGEL